MHLPCRSRPCDPLASLYRSRSLPTTRVPHRGQHPIRLSQYRALKSTSLCPTDMGFVLQPYEQDVRGIRGWIRWNYVSCLKPATRFAHFIHPTSMSFDTSFHLLHVSTKRWFMIHCVTARAAGFARVYRTCGLKGRLITFFPTGRRIMSINPFLGGAAFQLGRFMTLLLAGRLATMAWQRLDWMCW